MPNYDDLAQALASEGAAFGVFPQMGGRRKTQDVEAAKNIPVDILRGRVAGLLGAIPDLLNMAGRSPMPTETFGDTQYEPTKQLPYGSEHYLKTLPLAPTTQTGRVANEMGALVPLDPRTVVKAGKPVVSLLGNELARGMYGNEGSLANVIPTAMKPMMAAEPQMQMAQTITKPKAEVSPLGFYSAVEQQALNIPRKQGTGESFLNDLAKGQDVKKYEMETMGLDDFLKGKTNVTRQEVQDFIANNKIDVQERQLAGKGDKSGVFSEFNPDKNQFIVYGNDLSLHGAFNTAEEADNFVKQYNSQIPYGPSRYDKYQLPGGENYRELLLTLPEAMPNTALEIQQFTKRMETMRELQNEFANAGNMEKAISFAQKADDLQAYIKQLEKIPVTRQTENYQSSHFNEPNILAHMRVNDRVDAEGKKMLLIEEVQSDWHQAGREKGYQTKESLEKWYNQNKLDNDPAFADLNSEQRSVIERNRSAGMGGDTGVPDAPFKDTWHQLALKRALKEAVDKGYDRIGLTTGAQQAERYDLSKQIKTLIYSQPDADGLRRVEAVTTSGDRLLGKKYTENQISENVGKEIAEKIIKNTGEFDKKTNTYAMTGLDLQVGGEGMKKYYDEIYPNYLNKLGKKYGAQVGETNVKTQTSAPAYVDYIVGRGNFNDTTVLGVRSDGTTSIINQNANSMEEAQQLANRYKEKHLGGGQQKVRYLDITPEMRKAIKEGQPLASIEEELAKALA